MIVLKKILRDVGVFLSLVIAGSLGILFMTAAIAGLIVPGLTQMSDFWISLIAFGLLFLLFVWIAREEVAEWNTARQMEAA